MEHMNWSDTLSVGVPEIDEQHKRLLVLFNDVADAVDKAYDREATGLALRRLCDYTVEHFATEESYMDMDAYVHYDTHMMEHMDCTTKALEFLQDFSSGKDVDMHGFLAFVGAWVVDHIMGVDKKLGEFIIASGKPATA